MKRLMGLILALVMCFSLPAFAANEEGSSLTVSERNAPMVIIGDQDNTYVMAGTHNSSLLVESISSEEYMSMMSILYPNGVVDAQGQDISGVENKVH